MNRRALIFGFILAAWTTTAADTNWVGVVVHPVKDAATHDMLRSMLAEKDPVAREEALRALGRIGDPNDAGLVRERVRDPHPQVRLAAVRAAGTLGLSLTPEELEALSRDASPAVRAAVVAAIPSLAAPGKLDHWKRGLADKDAPVRRAAALAAARLAGSAKFVQEQWTSETDGAAAAEMFRVLLRAQRATPDRLRLLPPALASEHPGVVAAAISAMETAETEALGETILEKLGDPYRVVQDAAVRAAGRLKLEASVPALLEMLDDADAALRPAICATLGLMGGSDSVQALAQRLADDRDLFTQQAAADALRKIHSDEACEALVLMLESPRTTTRRESVRVLGQWDEPGLAINVNPLLKDSEPVVAAEAAQALGRLKHASSRLLLLERLKKGPAAVQERVAWALGQYRAKEAVPQLSKLLSSKHEALEATSAEALGLIGDKTAWPAMRKMLFAMLEHGATVRIKTLHALQRMGDRESLPRAFQIVTEKVIPPTPMMPLPTYDATPVREAALQFVIAHGDAATGEKLLKSFADTPPSDLRPTLAAAATKLTGRTYQPIPDESHTRYSVESLGPPPYPTVPPTPGLRLVEEEERKVTDDDTAINR